MVIRQFNENNLHLLPSKAFLEYDEYGLTVCYPLVCCFTGVVPCFDDSLMVILKLLLDDSRMNLLTKLRILLLKADNFYQQISVFGLNTNDNVDEV